VIYTTNAIQTLHASAHPTFDGSHNGELNRFLPLSTSLNQRIQVPWIVGP
jgi:hypothetical protein